MSARIDNRLNQHEISVSTNGIESRLTIPPKPTGYGSSANGGELLFLALATCYCNDLYREAARQNITVHRVQVEVTGEFQPEPGSMAENVTYHVRVEAEASEEEIQELIYHTDTVAEIQNTLRGGTSVRLEQITSIQV
jgi:uncharacterized OsmC-like protein